MLRPLLETIQQRPRLDLTLLSFALAGLAVALLLPPSNDTSGSPGSYALAITAGDHLRLEETSLLPTGTPAQGSRQPLTGTTVAPVARVLACRNVLSVGAVEIGAGCKGQARERVALSD